MPIRQVLFRPEKVVLTSSDSLVNDGIFREHVYQLARIRFNADTLNAMRAGIIEFDPVLAVLAADQQQEIYCSRYAKFLLAV